MQDKEKESHADQRVRQSKKGGAISDASRLNSPQILKTQKQRVSLRSLGGDDLFG